MTETDTNAPPAKRVRIGRQNRAATAAPPAEPKTRIRAGKEIEPPAAMPEKPARTLKTKPAEPAPAPEAVHPAYKLSLSPRGFKQFTYTLAVLTALGAFDKKRKAVPVADVRAFYAGNSAIRYNLDRGYFAEGPNDSIRVTEEGFQHFTDRITGSKIALEIHSKEVEAFVAAIKTGKLPFDTMNCKKSQTEFVGIKLINPLV